MQAFLPTHTACDFTPMIQCGKLEQIQGDACRSAFRIARASRACAIAREKLEPPPPGMRRRGRFQFDLYLKQKHQPGASGPGGRVR